MYIYIHMYTYVHVHANVFAFLCMPFVHMWLYAMYVYRLGVYVHVCTCGKLLWTPAPLRMYNRFCLVFACCQRPNGEYCATTLKNAGFFFRYDLRKQKTEVLQNMCCDPQPRIPGINMSETDQESLSENMRVSLGVLLDSLVFLVTPERVRFS